MSIKNGNWTEEFWINHSCWYCEHFIGQDDKLGKCSKLPDGYGVGAALCGCKKNIKKT